MKQLIVKGLVETVRSGIPAELVHERVKHSPMLNAEQAIAAAAIKDNLHHYYAQLLYGVTGSGKTEVYIDAARPVIEAGGQVLVLLPEIGLTPQLLSRIQSALACRVELSHSGLNDSERFLAWQGARNGEATVLIGTRSAVFTPMPKLGLIVVDEEHDGSLKQQDGFRYHARDLALVRARAANIPVVLASATPSLESLNNAARGQLQLCKLEKRAGAAQGPGLSLLDSRSAHTENGMSSELLSRMTEVLARGEQVIIFINRRGFAPVLMCEACGAMTDCEHCDAHMTYLSEKFPEHRVLRIDRDTTSRKGELQRHLAMAASGEAQILVGTQMLAKGHDFPNVTLVGILDAFTDHLLSERKDAQWPPYVHIALLRSDSAVAGEARAFLQQVKEWLSNSDKDYVAQMCSDRKPLHQLLATLRPTLEKNPAARKVRWSLDVDPHDML